MHKSMNDVFGNFDFFFNDFYTAKSYEVKNEGDFVFLNIIAPGFKKENFSIKIKGDRINISMPEGKDKEFKLPDSVIKETATAEYAAGVLKIKFAKRETKILKIEVK